MSDWTISDKPIGPKPEGDTPVVHVEPRIQLMFYPGETTKQTNVYGETLKVTSGHIYVRVGGYVAEKYVACGGPIQKYSHDGHTAMPTTAGSMCLDQCTATLP